MKKIKLFTCTLLCVAMTLGLAACAAKEPENNNAESIAAENDAVAAVEESETLSIDTDGAKEVDTAEDTTTPETEKVDTAEDTTIPEAEKVDTAEDTTIPEAEDDTTVSKPSNIFPSMGVDNGYFFATPIANGEPVHAKMDEVRLFSAESNISTGAIVNLAGMDEEYIVIELDTYRISFVKDNPDEDDYDRIYSLTPGHLLYFEEESEPLQFLGNDGDINYRYIAGTLYATRNLDDYTLCISNHDISKEISEETKATVKNILDNITYVDEVEDTFASASSYFDAVAFDCGWYIDNIDYLQWRPKEMTLTYELKKGYLEFDFNLKENPEEETHNGGRATYSIPMEDETYLIISINKRNYNVFDIHNWAEVEAFLNGKK